MFVTSYCPSFIFWRFLPIVVRQGPPSLSTIAAHAIPSGLGQGLPCAHSNIAPTTLAVPADEGIPCRTVSVLVWLSLDLGDGLLGLVGLRRVGAIIIFVGGCCLFFGGHETAHHRLAILIYDTGHVVVHVCSGGQRTHGGSVIMVKDNL